MILSLAEQLFTQVFWNLRVCYLIFPVFSTVNWLKEKQMPFLRLFSVTFIVFSFFFSLFKFCFHFSPQICYELHMLIIFSRYFHCWLYILHPVINLFHLIGWNLISLVSKVTRVFFLTDWIGWTSSKRKRGCDCWFYFFNLQRIVQRDFHKTGIENENCVMEDN